MNLSLFFHSDHLKRMAKEKHLPGLTKLEENGLDKYLTRHVTNFGYSEFKRWCDEQKFAAPEEEKDQWNTDNILHPFAKRTV